MKIVAVTEVRSNSSRFPGGKHWRKLFMGTSVLEAIRVKAAIVLSDYDIPFTILTTVFPEDDWIADVYRAFTDVKVIRGSDWDLFSRKMQGVMAWENLEHRELYFLNISGDSPFFDVPSAKLLVAAAEKQPGYDVYGFNQTYNGIEGVQVSLHSSRFYHKAMDYVRSMAPEKREQWWVHVKGFEPETCLIDNPYLPKSATPIKTSIDYPADLERGRKVCEILGYIPTNYTDIVKVYMDSRWLTEEFE